MAATDISRHTLSVLVEDIDGIISRVAAMFTRRAFTMVSITSATTETPGVNRITIVVDTDEEKIEQITKQLNKLVPVLKVVRLAEDQMIARALLMVKVSADNSNRARVVDVAQESVVIEATGSHDKLRALLDVLEPFGIRELLE